MRRSATLRCYMSLMALDSMTALSTASRATFESRIEKIVRAGFEGVQFAERPTASQLAFCDRLNVGIAGSGRVNSPGDAAGLAQQMAEDGFECATLHVGWGLEDGAEACALIEGILDASAKWKIPLFIETHRATICQDMWRTVQFTKRFPEMRFNGDFSHWYAGQEMVYGGFERKLAFIDPIIQRVRFLHGRIANPGCIQVGLPADGAAPRIFVQHFREMWTACFRAFLNSEEREFICFTPELLGPDIYYARTFEGVEEADRWEQSLLLNEMAKECFQFAQSC